MGCVGARCGAPVAQLEIGSRKGEGSISTAVHMLNMLFHSVAL